MALLGSDTSVTGPFPKGVLLLETLAGTEQLGLPYVFQLGLLSEDPNLDPADVLGKPLAVGIKLGTGETRYFHGIVTSFEKSGMTRLHTRYAVRLRPFLTELDLAHDCRIFNEPAQDALGIVTSVLAERGMSDLESGSIKDHAYRARELCVQYRETDLCFVQRLLEEEGIYYFFRHEESKHTMVLADSIAAHETAAGYETVLYTPEERHAAGAEEHLWGMQVRQGLYPGRHTVLSGYDATAYRPKRLRFGESASGEPAPGSEFEHYDYPGGLCDPEEARGEATLRTQAGRVDQTVTKVEGNTLGLGVADLVTLRPSGGEEIFPSWRAEDFGKQYLIIEAHYRLSIDQYETGTVAGSDEPYRATYWLLDSQIPFRPQRSVKKPRIGGPQTALVVGPAGEEIWTDKQGRVRIQLDWDRLGGRNEKSTCWVRVAQIWAGGAWGGIHVPRVGQEVIVRFLDGDPDRPIAAGSLYSADHPPPYEVPANQTQSGIKSRSSKGGAAANFNEIRFEDKKGAEELHVQAEKDMSTVVKRCQTLLVGVNRSIVVGKDEDTLVKANRLTTVNGKDSEVINGDHDKTVVGTVFQIYGDDHSRKVDGEQELFEEQNKEEHVKQAYTLTTDKKFQVNQDATSMTFKRTNVTLDSAGVVTLLAGGATVCVEQTGMTTFASPTGIILTCGASSLAITPAGIAVASPAVTAAAGGASKLALGSDGAGVTSKKVTIEATGVCSIRGKKVVRLQESDALKSKKRGKSSGAGEKEAAASAKAGKQVQKGADPDSPVLEIHVVDLDGKPQEGLAFEIKKPDGGTEKGKLDTGGRGKVQSSKPGAFTVTFPDLDGADWDGDGASPLPSNEGRSEASKYEVKQGDRLPTIARRNGFARWQTIWDHAGNAALRKLRRDGHILLPKDEVSIPTKLPRKAEVQGGRAEYTLQSSAEILRVRFADAESDNNHPVTYRAKPDTGPESSGQLSSDGLLELVLPTNATRVLVRLFVEDEDEPIQTHELRVGHLDPTEEISGIQARLTNLGYYQGEITGRLDVTTAQAISNFRQAVLGAQGDQVDDALVSALDRAYHGETQ